MLEGDALELAQILHKDFVAAVEAWGETPAFLVVNPKIFAIQGIETANVFEKIYINNRELIRFRGVEVLKTEFITQGVYPFKFVR